MTVTSTIDNTSYKESTYRLTTTEDLDSIDYGTGRSSTLSLVQTGLSNDYYSVEVSYYEDKSVLKEVAQVGPNSSDIVKIDIRGAVWVRITREGIVDGDNTLAISFNSLESPLSPTINAQGGQNVTIINTPLITKKQSYAYREAIDSVTSTIQYIGLATIGTLDSAASWQIQRNDFTSGSIGTWADGNENFDNIWDNRESLTYS